MAKSVDCNIVVIHLKEAKKNYRMDICGENLEMIQNGAIIIDKQLVTIIYFPESFSNQNVQAQMKTNSCKILPSVRKCLCSLNQQKRNIVLVDNNHVYATEQTDNLVQIFLDISNEYGKIYDLEYDAVKNCLQERTKSKNGIKDVVSSTPTERFESNMDGMNSNLPLIELSFYPIFRTNPDNMLFLTKIVHNRIDQLFDAPLSMGEIVQDEGGQDSLSPQSLPQQSTDKGGFVAIAVGNTYSVSSFWPRHGTFKIIDARIASFANISEVRGLDTKRMAWNGLFFTGV
ncbi:hypothetical protein CHS0354_039297 [Potamilus streckersoni]|uniref:Uncharacterized protein n=1 Tax=Potamilus streckersoni TaxID=2493646 RepID=A0AAE0VGZ7_9BIVA|nr:hypothetical protein CHS0354_039297 [Potamilus streckersoni]